MIFPNQEIDELGVIDKFPFPISFIFINRVFEETSPERRVRGIVQTVENTLRYLAMLVAAEYVGSPLQDKKMNLLIEALDRPKIGNFQGIVQQGIECLSKKGHEWFMPELPSFARRLKSLPGLRTSKGRQALLESLVNLRNRLAHHEYDPNWLSLYETYYPLLLTFLQQLEFLSNYSLCRIIEADALGNYAFLELMGPSPVFAKKQTSLPNFDEDRFSSVFILNRVKDNTLLLSPFVVMHACEDCISHQEIPGLTEEVFLLNGIDDDTTVFIGVRHYLQLQNLDIVNIKKGKKFLFPQIDVDSLTGRTLIERAEYVTSQFIEAQIHQSIYIPQIYQPRSDVEKEISSFLDNDCNGFLLLGESGIGKTNLFCHLAKSLSDIETPVVYYPAADLDFAALEKQILSDLCIKGDLNEVLAVANESLDAPIVLLIDGLNEHSSPAKAFRQVDEFIQRFSRSRLKVILSFRTSHFGQVLETLVDTRFDPEGTSFFRRGLYHTGFVNKDGAQRESYQHILRKFDADDPDLESMYEKYRALSSDTSVLQEFNFGPLTPFSALSAQVRTLISHPWYLRLVVEIYDESDVPTRIFTTDILREYCQRSIYQEEETADFIEHFVELMMETETTFVTRAELRQHPGLSLSMQDTIYDSSPYRKLVDRGVLSEIPETTSRGLFTTTRYRVQFAFDTVLEFLLANHFMEGALKDGGITSEHIQEMLIRSSTFTPLTGAIQFIWYLSAPGDNGQLIIDSVERSPNPQIVPPLIATLRTLEAHRHVSYENVISSFAQKGTPREAFILHALGYGMSLENSVKAQNRVFDLLYEWSGEGAKAFRMIAGSYLLFGSILEQEEERTVEIYNHLQESYAEDNRIAPNYIRFEMQLTPTQIERINQDAWTLQAYGYSLLNDQFAIGSKKTPSDEMIDRLNLSFLSPPTRHALARVISMLARYKAMSNTDAVSDATIRMWEQQQTGDLDAAFRSFDQAGIDLHRMIEEAFPDTLSEVEADLEILYKAYYPILIRFPNMNELIENIIRQYICDREAIDPLVSDKLSYRENLIEISKILAKGHDLRGDRSRAASFLLRAVEYAETSPVSERLLSIYEKLIIMLAEIGRDTDDYDDRYLALSAYFSLSEERQTILLQHDIVQKFYDYIGTELEPGERTLYFNVHRRCSPWLKPDEHENLFELANAKNKSQWESLLRARVPLFDRIYAEECALIVILYISFLAKEDKKEPRYQDSQLVDLVIGRVVLFTLSIDEEPIPVGTGDSNSVNTGKREPLNGGPLEESDSVLLKNIKLEAQSNWNLYDQDTRLANAASLAILPTMLSLTKLETDVTFCNAIDKELGSDAAQWIQVLARCWFADVLKGRRGSPQLQKHVKDSSEMRILAQQESFLTFFLLTTHQAWLELRSQIPVSTIQSIISLTESVDNIDEIIAVFQQEISNLKFSIPNLAEQNKNELIEIHNGLRDEFT